VRLALAIARVAYPDLEPEKYLLKLGAMADRVAPRVVEAAPGGARALALVQSMRLDLEMRGNTERYYDASNSFLNVVIERRTGLPIMLSLILVTIGQRLGLSMGGAGFPGHFMARYEDEHGVWFLDPFHGSVMTAEDVPAYLVKLFGQSVVSLDPDYFEPVTPVAWAQRILNNLHAVYLNAGELAMLAKILPLMLVLEPDRQELWQELGLVEYRLGELTLAARALRRMFFLQGHLMVRSPDALAAAAPPMLDGSARQLWELLEEIEAARTRWN
jgi:regulator of sirC expression with transglutaminase-like and TPR domain